MHFDDVQVTAKTKSKELLPLRRKVGVVFQFAEQQLFEETVLKDIIFGPLNYGVPKEEAIERAYRLATLLAIDESLFSRSPFELSRRTDAACGDSWGSRHGAGHTGSRRTDSGP